VPLSLPLYLFCDMAVLAFGGEARSSNEFPVDVGVNIIATLLEHAHRLALSSPLKCAIGRDHRLA
jgi:hypothetical protein